MHISGGRQKKGRLELRWVRRDLCLSRRSRITFSMSSTSESSSRIAVAFAEKPILSLGMRIQRARLGKGKVLSKAYQCWSVQNQHVTVTVTSDQNLTLWLIAFRTLHESRQKSASSIQCVTSTCVIFFEGAGARERHILISYCDLGRYLEARVAANVERSSSVHLPSSPLSAC